MPETSPGDLSSEVVRLRVGVESERHREILDSLTTRTTVEVIESIHPDLADPGEKCHPAERESFVAEWQMFRAAAANGGEVWAFRSVGSASSFEGFAVVRGGRIVAECITSISTWI